MRYNSRHNVKYKHYTHYPLNTLKLEKDNWVDQIKDGQTNTYEERTSQILAYTPQLMIATKSEILKTRDYLGHCRWRLGNNIKTDLKYAVCEGVFLIKLTQDMNK